jgi:hypothetical protein
MAIDKMIVYKSARLQVSINNSASNKFKSSANQVFAERIGFICCGRNLEEGFTCMNKGPSADEFPDILIETPKLFLYF